MTFPSKIDVMKFKNKRSCTSVTNMHIEKKNEQIFVIKRNKKYIHEEGRTKKNKERKNKGYTEEKKEYRRKERREEEEDAIRKKKREEKKRSGGG